MHKQSSEWTVGTPSATGVGCFHGNAASDKSRDCTCTLSTSRGKTKTTTLSRVCGTTTTYRSDHGKLAQTHSCFRKLFQSFVYMWRLLSIKRCKGLKILYALQFYIYNYNLRCVLKVFQVNLTFLLREYERAGFF